MKALFLAQAGARRLGDESVGTAILVAGIVEEGTDLGSRALAELGITTQTLQMMLQATAKLSKGGAQAIEVPFSDDTKAVLEDACSCAQAESSAVVTTAHLLQAIISREDSDK